MGENCHQMKDWGAGRELLMSWGTLGWEVGQGQVRERSLDMNFM